MRLTTREYARRVGLSQRAIRQQLAQGRLSGVKQIDPDSGAELWLIDVPDEEGPGTSPTFPGTAPFPVEELAGEIAGKLREVYEGHIRELERQNLELAGRCGFLQGKLGEVEARLALSAPRRPWWRRWRQATRER